jgi:hypothetical protein
MKMKNYFKLMPHQSISENYNNVYSLIGSMQLFGIFKYSRNMIILKDGDRLCLVNPVRLNEEEEKKLLSMGKIHSILKLGRLHSVDVPYYMDKFSPKLWASCEDSFLKKHDYSIDIDLEKTSSIPFLDIQIYSLKTSKENEAVAYLPQDGGVLLACDALVNMKKIDPMANWLVRTLSKILPEPTYIGPNWYKAMKPKKEDFEDILKFKFDKMIPAHGPILKGNADKKIKEYVNRFKF